MARDNSEHLRLDSRLANRKDWISSKDLADALEAIPDVADKAEYLGGEEEEEGGGVSLEGPPSIDGAGVESAEGAVSKD